VAETPNNLRQQLDTRLNTLENQRLSWWIHWGIIADYFLPRRYRWLITPNQAYRGVPINQRIIDSTGVLALRTLTAGLMSGLTSPSNPWFSLTLADTDLANSTPVKLWLDEVRKRIMKVMSESNFYLGMSVLYEDLGCFGTGMMIIYEDQEDIIRVYNPCAGEGFLAQSSRLQVDTLYRKFTLSARQGAQQFGKDNLSPSVAQQVSDGMGAQDTEFVVGHAIEPTNDNYGPPKTKLPWREMYWEYGSSQNLILSERGFHEFPAICPRWYLSGNDVYGRSPTMDALGDQKQLQVEQKRKMQGIDKQVNPPLLADQALKNEPASTVPGGVTYVPQIGQVGGMKPVYMVQPNLRDMMEDIKEVQERIKQMLFYDLFLMISQLDTVRTATEIIERKQEKLLMLSPMLERMFTEALDPAVRRIAKICGRAGIFPPMPTEMRGHSVEIQYTSVLAQAQKSVATQGMERMAAMIGNLAAGNPEAIDKLDVDEYIDEYNDLLGNNPRIIRSTDAANELRHQRAQQQAAAEAAQATIAGVEGAKTLSETPVGGGQTALTSMLGAT
jgi:hypothetical protein